MQKRGLILCCGMIRSASTVQYQVIVDLVKRNGLGQSIGFADRQSVLEVLQKLEKVVGLAVAKTHEVLPEFDALIQQDMVSLLYTFRDLRAVALSVMRKWEIPFAHVIGRNGWLDTAVESSMHWLAVPGVCVSRYEDIVQSLPAEVTKWAGALGLNITCAQAEELATKYCLQAQQDRIRNMRIQTGSESSSYIDPESLLHHNHIIDGSLDGWKTGLARWQIRQIESRFSKWLLDHGYQLTTAVK
jgi:Sulfotransferase domain